MLGVIYTQSSRKSPAHELRKQTKTNSKQKTNIVDIYYDICVFFTVEC
jgi:hypothetical protein